MTIILWMFAATLLAAGALKVANDIADSNVWRARLLYGDSVATQATAIVEDWFRSAVESGDIFESPDFMPESPPMSDPVIKISEDIMARIEDISLRVSIDVEIIDQNYADSYKTIAAKKWIPQSTPAIAEINDGSGTTVECHVKYVSIRVSARSGPQPESAATRLAGYIVILTPDGRRRFSRLYIKKDR